jgi:hypothetical protein
MPSSTTSTTTAVVDSSLLATLTARTTSATCVLVDSGTQARVQDEQLKMDDDAQNHWAGEVTRKPRR